MEKDLGLVSIANHDPRWERPLKALYEGHDSIKCPTSRKSWLPRTLSTWLLASILASLTYYFFNVTSTPFESVARQSSPSLSSSGVTFDQYSLLINDKRIFLSSGEFHPWRLPVPDLWLDVLQKMKAIGLNGVSIYTHWGMISPEEGKLNFEGINDLQRFLDAAMEAGLFVTIRPGPYINAETTGGGIPGWVAATVTNLRDNSTAYYQAWKPYMETIARIAAANQVDKGGPVILFQVENEYKQNNLTIPYMKSLIQIVKDNGVTVPITFNDVNERDNFARGPGAVELYGFDNYPLRFDCSNPSVWPSSVPETHHTYHKSVNPEQPLYFPEYQAGAFDAWGPTSPGYDNCRELLDSAFQSVYYRNLWAQNAKMINYYMAYGGTNWGQIAFPGVYTSYEETRQLSIKVPELKRQLTFLRSVKDFHKTIQLSNSSVKEYTSNPDIYVTELRNPDNAAGFYIVRHKDTRTKTVSNFTIEIDGVRSGLFNLSMKLRGRESLLIPADIPFADTYIPAMTAQIYFAGLVGGNKVLYVYQDLSPSFLFTFALPLSSNLGMPSIRGGSFSFTQTDQLRLFSVEATEKIVIIAWERSDTFIILSEPPGTDRYWAPILSMPSASSSLALSKPTHDNFDAIGSTSNILVWGPYLLRTAQRKGSDLYLTGDVDRDTILNIISPPFDNLYWNGEAVVFKEIFWKFFWGANITFGNPVIDLPNLEELDWKMKDGLPEKDKYFDDESWVVTEKDLNACKYGFCVGHVLYRGHFKTSSSSSILGIDLTLRGGTGFAASVFVDGKFIGNTYGNSTNHYNDIPETHTQFQFPENFSTLNGKDHVVTILCDNMGLEESNDSIFNDTIKDIRGLVSWDYVYQKQDIDDAARRSMIWKVQGNILNDEIRGILNAGGLYGERNGWHFNHPEPEDSDWKSLSPVKDGVNEPSVKWFKTSFDLNIPKGYDVPIYIELPKPVTTGETKRYRAQIYVNGWQMGKYVSYMGPQSKFVLQEGILNYHGVNDLSIALWALDGDVVKLESLKLGYSGVYKTDLRLE